MQISSKTSSKMYRKQVNVQIQSLGQAWGSEAWSLVEWEV